MKKGFTIIELIIVISVLVILIGIIVPRMSGMQQQGNIVKVKAELQTLQSAMESYYNNEAGTTKTYPATSTAPCATYFVTATPQIIGSVIYDPFNSSNEYKLVTNGSFYVFASVGPTSTSSLSGLAINASTGAVTGNGAGSLCITNGSGC
ncbi:MAG: prepilin-type N-terminal cleavage/methylation domain-containing protein [Candidatus Omnitrophica bacterium]|nr:prepilin-type N-terminal cleavage/methylation domain-containing protein [Candidatus Omnitrophota bacterium]